MNHLRANLWLLVLTVVICCVLYPGVLWIIGQTVFHEKANGSLILDKDGKTVIGSHLIAQPFSGDQYFQPRPSSASYNAAASGASNWGANNYLLRERVARQLGPIVKYRQEQKPVAPDIESWFQKNEFQGKPAIVAQWAAMHGNVATNWVKADKMNADYVTAWQKDHATEVEVWKKENPDNDDPKPEELKVPFFASFSKEHPGAFPSAVEHDAPDGKKEKKIEPVKDGSDIQGIFFDLWLQDHPKADLEPVPADMVMASGSGLDPHITLKNAFHQLDRVAGQWAGKATPKRDVATVRKEIETLLRKSATAPLGGFVGVELINVLEINLALRERYGNGSNATH